MSQADAAKKVAELVAQAKALLEEAKEIAATNEFDFLFYLGTDGQTGYTYASDETWEPSQEWYDSGCSIGEEDWQSSDMDC